MLITYAAFGTIYLTPTILLHHFPNLAVLARPLPFPTPKLIELRVWVMHKGERVARTLLAQPYPPDLSIAYGSLVAEAWELRTFALAQGLPIPFAPLPESHGLPGTNNRRVRDEAVSSRDARPSLSESIAMFVP